MTTEQALAFFLFAVVAAITPGPSNLILWSSTIYGSVESFSAMLPIAAIRATVAIAAIIRLRAEVTPLPQRRLDTRRRHRPAVQRPRRHQRPALWAPKHRGISRRQAIRVRVALRLRPRLPFVSRLPWSLRR